MKIDFLQKLRKQPKIIRKIIFLSVIIAISILLSFKIVKDFQKGLENLKGIKFGEKINFQLPSLEKEIPKLETENLKNLLKRIEEESK